MDIVKFEKIENKIIELRDQKVILDSDVAQLYGVGTKEINQAVKNNPEKFLQSYIFPLTTEEKTELVKNFDRFNSLKHSTVKPKAFTEKGLYMLATILKSPKATQTTIAIIEAFAKLRQLTRNIKELSATRNKDAQKSLMKKSGGLITELFDDGLSVSGSETTIELNFAVLKLKHTIKKTKNEK